MGLCNEIWGMENKMRYWKKIKLKEKVIETRSGWKVKNESIYWQGNEALTAQKWLHKRAMKDKRKK